MGRFEAELPNDIIKQFDKMSHECEDMMQEMVDAGTNVVYNNIRKNMQGSFKTTKSLEKGLTRSKSKELSSKDGYGAWAGFDGYDTSRTSKKHPKGIPIPLIALAREYGTSRGESAKPFMRKSVNRNQINKAMEEVFNKYSPKE